MKTFTWIRWSNKNILLRFHSMTCFIYKQNLLISLSGEEFTKNTITRAAFRFYWKRLNRSIVCSGIRFARTSCLKVQSKRTKKSGTSPKKQCKYLGWWSSTETEIRGKLSMFLLGCTKQTGSCEDFPVLCLQSLGKEWAYNAICNAMYQFIWTPKFVHFIWSQCVVFLRLEGELTDPSIVIFHAFGKLLPFRLSHKYPFSFSPSQES